MSKSKLIRLYAKNAVESRPGSYECNLDNSQLSNVVSMALKTAIFRNNVYNVFTSGEQKNNEFIYEIKADDAYTLTIPTDGFYTTQQICDYLSPLIEAQLQVLNPAETFVMSVGVNSGKVEVVHTGGETIQFDAVGSLNILLGNTTSSGGISGTTYTFNDFASLGGLESVTINVASKSPKTILNVTNTKQRVTNSLGVIPVTVPFGGLQNFTQPDLDASMLVFSFPEDLTNIRFNIRDVDGRRLLDQTNHLVIELMVWFRLD